MKQFLAISTDMTFINSASFAAILAQISALQYTIFVFQAGQSQGIFEIQSDSANHKSYMGPHSQYFILYLSWLCSCFFNHPVHFGILQGDC